MEQHTPEEIAEVIKPSFPDADEDILIKVAQRYKENDAWCSDPIMKKEAFELLQEVMKEAGELTKEVPMKHSKYMSLQKSSRR